MTEKQETHTHTLQSIEGLNGLNKDKTLVNKQILSIENNSNKNNKNKLTWLLVFLLLSMLICWISTVISIISISEILQKLEVPSERMITVIVTNPDLKPQYDDKFYFFLSLTAFYFVAMVAGLFISQFSHRPFLLSDTMDAFGILLFSMLTLWNIFTFTTLHKKPGNSKLTGSKVTKSTGSKISPIGKLFNFPFLTINLVGISDQFKKELLSFDLRVREELTDNLGINETTITDCQLFETINPIYVFLGIFMGILFLRKLGPRFGGSNP